MPWQRQFMNLVVHEHYTRRYTLHRIRLSKSLFYEATENATAQEVAKAQEAARAKKKSRGCLSTLLNLRQLPRPEIFFLAQPSLTSPNNSHFLSLLSAQGEGCVMCLDNYGSALLYDVYMQLVIAMPQPNFRKLVNSITLSMASTNRPCGEHNLYVMSTEYGNFELFNHCRTSFSSLSAIPNDWNWQPLGYVPPCMEYSCYNVDAASPPFAAAVVDNSTICASSREGTYAFDMSRGVWRQAGRWTLPFHGAAEYVPEFRLWFALEGPKASSRHRLCAFDLAASAMAESSPTPWNAWDYLDGLPHRRCPSERQLVNLGMGKFCIPTHCFNRTSYPEEVKLVRDEVTVLTGVEVVCASDGLQMINHKYRHYIHDENFGIHLVL